jgi:hypothetical protein
MSFTVLWQHVFQVVVCVLSALQRAIRTVHVTKMHGTTINPSHYLPDYSKPSLLLITNKINLVQFLKP